MNHQNKHEAQLNRRQFIGQAATAVCGLSVIGAGAAVVAGDPQTAAHGMRAVSEASKVIIAKDSNWYQGFTGVAVTKGVLVAAYLRTDQHLRNTTDIMVARSEDGGRTWMDHKSIAHSNVNEHGAVWVAPELNRLRDGRLVLICDLGNRKPGQELPVLAIWQSKERGMSNHILISEDAGRTWTGPRKVDDVGGEPGRVHELSNGTFVYTRTDSKPTKEIKNPVAPWGPIYYKSTAVFSDDQGETWNRTAALTDDPLVGDCEVDLVELAPGRLMAVTRIGDAGSRYGQPSRFVYSNDYGRTWSKPVLSPIYAHRPIPGLLKSGKVLITFRNQWGTTGSYAVVLDPNKQHGFQPNSFIWDEVRCALKDDAMELRTADGSRHAVQFSLYPVEDDDSAVEMEFELAVKEADKEGCLVSAGAWVRFEPNRVSLADREAEGFAIDTTRFHHYRLVNRDKKLSLYVDAKLKLQTATDGIHTRYVRFGNRPGVRPPVGTVTAETKAESNNYLAGRTGNATDKFERTPLRGVQYHRNTSHTLWRAVAAKVMNRRDHSIDWRWTAKRGYPDQFRRDRCVRLDYNGTFAAGDGGYSGWTQMDDGRIVIVDYTTGAAGTLPPFVRAYLVNERDLI